jgi:vacuolar protein sorting-associated protein 13A/C
MDTDLKRICNPLDTLIRDESDNTSGETKIYLDNLHLSPLKIHVSFSMHGANASEQLLAEHPIGDFLLQTINLAEVQDVVLKYLFIYLKIKNKIIFCFRLNCYERKNDRYPLTKLTNEIIAHYENQFLKQIHVVVLGLDVLGNPIEVIRGVKEGVESFFYEPYKVYYEEI